MLLVEPATSSSRDARRARATAVAVEHFRRRRSGDGGARATAVAVELVRRRQSLCDGGRACVTAAELVRRRWSSRDAPQAE